MASERKARGARPRAANSPKPQKHVRLTPRQREIAGEGPLDRHWRTYFLQSLAETSNVTRAAEHACVAPSRAYKTRREDPEFAVKWLAALREGYDNLEMEVLGYLRDPAPARKMDVTAALRLLSAHRETVERQRAIEGEEDPEAVFHSIDSFLEGMKQRRAANTAILAEAKKRKTSGDGA